MCFSFDHRRRLNRNNFDGPEDFHGQLCKVDLAGDHHSWKDWTLDEFVYEKYY